MNVWILHVGYDDGYEKFYNYEYNGSVFSSELEGIRAKEYLLENGLAKDDNDYYCYVQHEIVFSSFEEWKSFLEHGS